MNECAPNSDVRRDISVLVVDNDDAARQAIHKYLSRFSSISAVHTASSGEEAFQLCSERRGEITLVISGSEMPGMNGRELFRRLKADGHEVRTLLCAGSDDKIDSDQEGLVGFVRKPFTSDSLLWQVAKALT
jgi:CheY-like chemotaxis protein